MRNYQHFDELFNRTRKPPRSKKYAENQRPLRRVPESWLMLQKDPHSYVVKIGNTEVARYFQPDEHGNYEVAIRGLHATYDIHLMWKFTGIYSRMTLTTTTGDTVEVPLNPYFKDQDKDFSAVLCFNSSDQLIVEKSWHSDVYKKVSTNEDKEKRKTLKAHLDAYVTLQMFKLATLKDSANVSDDLGAPFAEEGLKYQKQCEMREFLKSVPSCLDSPAFASLFDEVAQDVFNMLASKKVYNIEPRLFWTAHGYYGSRHPEEKEQAQGKIDEIVDTITPDELKKSLIHRLMKYTNLTKGSQKVALPQFSNTLPNTFLF